MKPTFILSLLAFSAVTNAAEEPVSRQGSTQMDQDFDLGLQLQSCLASKCQIFKGHIVTDGPKHGQPISIHVEDILFGPQASSATIAVPYESEVLPDAFGISALWRDVKTEKGTPVTVALVLEPSVFTVQTAGQATVVTSTEQTAQKIEMFLRENRVTLQGSALAGPVASLSKTVDPILAGYLVGRINFLMTWKWPSSQESKTELFAQIIGSPSVPPSYARLLCEDLAKTYSAQPPSMQTRILSRFVELTHSQEPLVVSGGVAGISRVLELDSAALHLLSPALVAGFRRTYQEQVAKGALPRDEAIERGLRADRQ